MNVERGIVELLGTDRSARPGATVGLGFVVNRRTVVTCAHVVNIALGRDVRAPSKPDDRELVVRFPFARGAQRSASLVKWAPSENEDFDRTDLAGLSLEQDAPTGVEPVTLGRPSDFSGEPRVGMWGPVAKRMEGGHITGILLGLLPNGRRQLNQEVVGTFRAAPGFSGGPIWLLHGTSRVVGLLVAIAGRDEARDVYVLDVDRLAGLWPEQLLVEDAASSLEVSWGPAGFGLSPGEFVYVLPGSGVVECALVVANRGSDLENITRIDAEVRVVQRVPRLGGDEVTFGLSEFRLDSAETEDGLNWQQNTKDRWIIDLRLPLPAGQDIELPVIGLAISDNDAAFRAAIQYVAVPSLALECRVTVFTERQRISTNISGPLRIFSDADEGGDGGIEALLNQLDVSAGGERESLRAAYLAVLRYHSEVRKSIAQALNETRMARPLALADAAIAREPNNPEGHAARAAILDQIGRYEDAVESFDTAISLGPDTADLQLGRGLALSSLERETEALTSFDRALKLNPNLPEPHYWRAISLLSSERPDGEVLAELEEALRLGFTNPTALSAVQDLLEGDAAVEFRHLVDRYHTPRIE